MTHENQILETIDCTPTWEALLPAMLTILRQSYQQLGRAGSRTKADESITTLTAELKRMAAAADKWNEHCKAQ